MDATALALGKRLSRVPVDWEALSAASLIVAPTCDEEYYFLIAHQCADTVRMIYASFGLQLPGVTISGGGSI